MQIRPGQHLKLFQESVDEDNCFEGVAFTRQNGNDDSLLTTRDTLVRLANQYITKRFSNFNEDPVLKAAAFITDPFL